MLAALQLSTQYNQSSMVLNTECTVYLRHWSIVREEIISMNRSEVANEPQVAGSNFKRLLVDQSTRGPPNLNPHQNITFLSNDT